MDILFIKHRVNLLKEFDYVCGQNGEVYLFHYGRFVSTCENWHEVEEEQEEIFEREVAV